MEASRQLTVKAIQYLMRTIRYISQTAMAHKAELTGGGRSLHGDGYARPSRNRRLSHLSVCPGIITSTSGHGCAASGSTGILGPSGNLLTLGPEAATRSVPHSPTHDVHLLLACLHSTSLCLHSLSASIYRSTVQHPLTSMAQYIHI